MDAALWTHGTAQGGQILGHSPFSRREDTARGGVTELEETQRGLSAHWGAGTFLQRICSLTPRVVSITPSLLGFRGEGLASE